MLQAEMSAALCGDPECVDPITGARSIAEPEQDGEHQYLSCAVCGFEYGWRLVQTSTDSACAIGVPEEVRKAASFNMEQALQEQEPKGVPVSIGRKK